MLGVHRRLHPLLPAGRGGHSRTARRRALRRALRRRHPLRGYPEGVSVIDQVRGDMTSAMKSGEKNRVGALRLVLSELQKAQKEGSSDELADQEEAEARIIETYMPAELDDAELAAIVQAAIAETGASDPKDMGQVMKVVMAKSGGRADGKRASARVREALSAQ